MNRQQAKSTLLIFTTFVLFIIVGTLATILITNTRRDDTDGEEEYDTRFGTLVTPISQSSSTSLSTFSTIDITTIQAPNTVYEIDQTNTYFPSETIAQKLAQTMNIKEVVRTDDLLAYATDDSPVSVEYYSDMQSITILLNPETVSGQATLPDQTKAKLLAKKKLQELTIWPYEEEYETSFIYYNIFDNEYVETEDTDNASIVGVNFIQTINDIPIVASNQQKGEIEVLINLSSEVIKIQYNHRPIDTGSSATYPVVSAQQALQNVNYGMYELVLPYGGNPSKSVTIQDASVAYKLEYTDQQYLQPIYLFQGTDDYEQNVTIVIPAIEQQYLSETAE